MIGILQTAILVFSFYGFESEQSQNEGSSYSSLLTTRINYDDINTNNLKLFLY